MKWRDNKKPTAAECKLYLTTVEPLLDDSYQLDALDCSITIGNGTNGDSEPHQQSTVD